MHKILARTALGAAIVLATGLGTTAAYADDSNAPVPPEGIHTETGLSITGYDADVAAANGFEIVVHDDGSWESVPVTPAAVQVVEEYGDAGLSAGSSAARNTVYGNCGSATMDADRSGNLVTTVSGYDVVAPVSNRISWSVVFVSWNGVSTVSFPSGPSPVHWRGTAGMLNATAGYATAYGDVVLITGAVCGSGAPSDSF